MRDGELDRLVVGKPAFAVRVNVPAIAMPERSYMRASLVEMANEIRDELAGAANRVVS